MWPGVTDKRDEKQPVQCSYIQRILSSTDCYPMPILVWVPTMVASSLDHAFSLECLRHLLECMLLSLEKWTLIVWWRCWVSPSFQLLVFLNSTVRFRYPESTTVCAAAGLSLLSTNFPHWSSFSMENCVSFSLSWEGFLSSVCTKDKGKVLPEA